MIRYFVTATGTGIGKTFVTAALTHLAVTQRMRVTALKPIVSGFDEADFAETDSGVLLRAQRLNSTEIARISPWRFVAPLSPDMAATRENRRIDLTELAGFCQDAVAADSDVVLIEGVGGIMVPLNDRETVVEWMRKLQIPVLLVAGSYLGTLSHTLTAMRVLAAAGLAVRAIVLNESAESPVPLAETAAVLERFCAGTPIVQVGRRIGRESWRSVPELAPLLECRAAAAQGG